MTKLIIGLTGLQGCGKGTIADILQREYQAGYFRFSSILGDILTRLAQEKTRDNFIKLSNLLRQGFGEDILSYAIERDALQSDKDLVVIDGIRRAEDIVALEPLPSFKLIAVEAPADLRFERLKMRHEKPGEQNLNWEQFLSVEQAPTEITIPFIMERASYRLNNAGTREELETHVRELMAELIKK